MVGLFSFQLSDLFVGRVLAKLCRSLCLIVPPLHVLLEYARKPRDSVSLASTVNHKNATFSENTQSSPTFTIFILEGRLRQGQMDDVFVATIDVWRDLHCVRMAALRSMWVLYRLNRRVGAKITMQIIRSGKKYKYHPFRSCSDCLCPVYRLL